MLAPPSPPFSQEHQYPEDYFNHHHSERLYTQKNAEENFFAGPNAHPILKELYDMDRAGTPALVNLLVQEYHSYLHNTWVPGAMKRVMSMEEERVFERNLLGQVNVGNELQQAASREVARRLSPQEEKGILGFY